jgi:hypothetical protein
MLQIGDRATGPYRDINWRNYMPRVTLALPFIMVVNLEMDDNFEVDSWGFNPQTIEVATKFIYLMRDQITKAARDSKDSDTPDATFKLEMEEILQSLKNELGALKEAADSGLDPTPNSAPPPEEMEPTLPPPDLEAKPGNSGPAPNEPKKETIKLKEDSFFIHESASQRTH